MPPNKEELKKTCEKKSRLKEEVERRFKAYDNDIKHWKDYDYIIINENLENCYRQIENIISVTRKFSKIFSKDSVIS